MNYLLDTNVVSELRRPRQSMAPGLLNWASSQAADQLFLSVVTIMEIEIGVARKERKDPTQGRLLRRWLTDDVLPTFEGRILPLDLRAARAAAALHVPDPRPERDALIAATALVHGLTVVTHNTSDFEGLVATFDPW